jgi:hypothetical protein
MLQAANRVRVYLSECYNVERQSFWEHEHRLPSLEQHANPAVLRLQFMSSWGVAECEVKLAQGGGRQHHCAGVYNCRLLLWVLRFEELSEGAG